MKNKGVYQKEEDVIQVSPSLQPARTAGGTNIWTGTQETSPEPPKEKRAKRKGGDEEPEEGEIIDSSDEEKGDENKGNAEISTSCDKSPAKGMEVVVDEPAVMTVNVNAGVNKHGDSSGDQCLN